MQRQWTQEDLQRLRELVAKEAPSSEIAVALDRSQKAVERRIETLRAAGSLSTRRDDRNTVSARPDATILAERDVRHAAPLRDLTGFLQGDPPVGYAALDKQGVMA
jgi:DNA-binding transcriptional ArsR family regulator